MNNSSRFRVPTSGKALLLVPAAAALVLAGCSSGDSDSSSASATTAANADAGPTCPTDAPGDDAEPQWEFDGTTGSIAVVGQTDDTAAGITVEAPFAVDQTTVQVLDEGDGKPVTDQSPVVVCYVGVDGRDGSTFDSSYESGKPVTFSPDHVVKGFQQALVGQKAGSSIAVAIPPADGYGEQGNPRAGIQGTDTIVFALKILEVH